MYSTTNGVTSIRDDIDNVPIEALSRNICDALGISDAQLVIVIDKYNDTHVFTGAPAEAASAGEPPADPDLVGRPPVAADFVGGPPTALSFGGGRSSTVIRHEADGCWWLIKSEQAVDGSQHEATKICIGAHGCPVGKRIP